MTSEEAAPAPEEPRRRVPWQAVGTVTAVLSLVAALVFNGIQVRNNGHQQRASREATELQLLTQLNGVVNDATLGISGVLNRANKTSLALSSRERALLDHALGEFDYVAWLFENRFLTLPAAKRYWLNALGCAYHSALLLEPRRELKRNFPALARFDAPCQ